MLAGTTYWIVLPTATLAGIALGWGLKWLKARLKLISSERIAARQTREMLQETDAERRQMLREAGEQLREESALIEKEILERRTELEALDKHLQSRSSLLGERGNAVTKLRNAAAERDKVIHEHEETTLLLKKEFLSRLEQISGTTKDALVEQIKEGFVNQEKRDAQHVVERLEEDAARTAEPRATELLVAAMQKLPVVQMIDNGPTIISSPTNEMIGRLISREGRFIRVLERLLDVELSIEESWEDFSLSSPDPIKREIGRATIDRLFKEGRLNPGKIDATVKSVTAQVHQSMKTEAQRVVQGLDIRNMRKEAILSLGRLLYRYSYGQNMLYHSKEVAHLSAMLAKQLGADPKIARRGGLLHDIGKGFAVDGKAHVEIGVELAEKWGENPKIINCIASHHDDTEQTCMEAVIVQIADAISGSRPGARRETTSNYLERVEKLEGIAEGFKGVDKAFAIYAGRELRILVNAERINDNDTESLAQAIVKKIEEDLSYPGKIKVTLIREVKSSIYTR